MRRSVLLCLLLLALPLAAFACDDETPPRVGVVATASLTMTATPTVAASASPAPSAALPTTAPPATSAPRPSASPTPGRVDGTVAPQNFGSTDPVTIKANPDPLSGSALLRDVRLGVHPEEGGWDRIVFEFARDLPPGRVEYVPNVAGCGSGMPVTVRGGAVLLVRFDQSAAHTDAGQPTVPNVINGAGETILEARSTCDFEGEVTWAVGVKARQRFKVTLLDNPRRVVIDVKQ